MYERQVLCENDNDDRFICSYDDTTVHFIPNLNMNNIEYNENNQIINSNGFFQNGYIYWRVVILFQCIILANNSVKRQREHK